MKKKKNKDFSVKLAVCFKETKKRTQEKIFSFSDRMNSSFSRFNGPYAGTGDGRDPGRTGHVSGG
jgi:hypothetical protein